MQSKQKHARFLSKPPRIKNASHAPPLYLRPYPLPTEYSQRQRESELDVCLTQLRGALLGLGLGAWGLRGLEVSMGPVAAQNPFFLNGS